MTLMLDTSVCIDMIKEHPSSILEPFVSHAVGDIGISVITLAELEVGAARFRALYRMWERDPHNALRYAKSPILHDQLERGDGRMEFVNLTRQYLQLGALVGVA